MTTSHVVLRDVKDADGSRLLQASLTSGGDIVIEGRDYGPGVEQVFGVREYEWVWTIQAASVGDLLRVLPAPAGDVLPHSETGSAGRTLPSSARSSKHTASQQTDGLASVTRCGLYNHIFRSDTRAGSTAEVAAAIAGTLAARVGRVAQRIETRAGTDAAQRHGRGNDEVHAHRPMHRRCAVDVHVLDPDDLAQHAGGGPASVTEHRLGIKLVHEVPLLLGPMA